MLYEKTKSINQPLSHHAIISIPYVLTALIFFVLCYLNTPASFWDFKFIDIINAVAQLATAAAFYIGFRQYKESKQKDRQATLVEECKILCAKLTAGIPRVHNDGNLNTDNLRNEVNKLCNLAHDFDIIFSAMSEDTNKAIARMYWQDMYFNTFQPHFRHLSYIIFLLHSGIPREVIDRAVMAEYSLPKAIHDNKEAPEVDQISWILRHEEIRPRLNPLAWDWLDQFQWHFYNHTHLNEVLYGVLNIVSMKHQSPLLYALYELRNETLKISPKMPF